MGYTSGIELKKSRRITLENALDKIYLVRDGGTYGRLSLPKCLIGKRIKIILVEDEMYKMYF